MYYSIAGSWCSFIWWGNSFFTARCCLACYAIRIDFFPCPKKSKTYNKPHLPHWRSHLVRLWYLRCYEHDVLCGVAGALNQCRELAAPCRYWSGEGRLQISWGWARHLWKCSGMTSPFPGCHGKVRIARERWCQMENWKSCWNGVETKQNSRPGKGSARSFFFSYSPFYLNNPFKCDLMKLQN